VREIAGELAGKAVVVQVNTQENPLLADRFAIRGIPALLLLEKGRVLATLNGAREKSAILAWFRENRPGR
jgi:thioredoxin 2